MNEEEISGSIAIIGMSGRFPGSSDIEQFWRNLCEGKESISNFSKETLKSEGISETLLEKTNYVRSRGILEGIEWFDADFFSMSDKEASLTDPQHRLFLECSWEALESAGYCPSQVPGSVGVFAGVGTSSYFLHHLHPHSELRESIGSFQMQIGNDKDFLATKVSYKLNLKGPSLSIQTACSTSLVAVSVACNHLLTYQCDMALAGGSAIAVPQTSGYLYHEGMILSPDGRCRPFDREATGTVMSNGVGLVVLKRLSDAIQDKDYIYAVIRGYGLNNDGSEKIGYAAPSIGGQAEVISSALSMAGIDPETIGFVEAHGTGTFLGDPIEIKGLLQAFNNRSNGQTTAIGSVKSNIGHTVEAAGVIGLIKTALALHHRKIPATLHFKELNPHIEFSKTPFYVNSELKEWEAKETPRRACVSSFGVGGTNAHVVLEEWQNTLSCENPSESCLILSARSLSALKMMAQNLGRHLASHPEISLADAAHTLRVGRKRFGHLREVICNSREEAISTLLNFDPDRHLGKAERSTENESGRRVPLPTYPFERKRHWIDPPSFSEKPAPACEKKSELSVDEALMEIWKECLGASSIGIHEDFYEAGGDSLSAIQAASLIQQKLGVRLGMQALLEYRTIAKLSQVITEQIPSMSHLVLLKAGSGDPFFLIHPIEGNLFSYRNLVDRLSCLNPIYGLQAVGSRGQSIEEIALRYLKEIWKIQPHGPYRLFGVSFGGLIAYEMARQLQEAKRPVDLLAMADIVRPDSSYLPLSDGEAMLVHLLELLEGNPIASEEVTRERILRSLKLEKLPEKEQETLLARVEHHLKLLSSYHPQPYTGDVLYFQAKERFFRMSDLCFGSTWKQLVSRQVEIKEVPGDHLTMMAAPNVDLIANCLNQRLKI